MLYSQQWIVTRSLELCVLIMICIPWDVEATIDLIEPDIKLWIFD